MLRLAIEVDAILLKADVVGGVRRVADHTSHDDRLWKAQLCAVRHPIGDLTSQWPKTSAQRRSVSDRREDPGPLIQVGSARTNAQCPL